jgi:tyrosine-protein kinase Etk/Wzc
MKSIVGVKGGPGATGKHAQSLRDEVRHLWSRMQLNLPSGQGEVLRLAFCSTHPGEGATTVAANFSIFLGEQGRKTCIVEANLRRPSLADHFCVPRSPGLCEYLDGTAQLKEATRREVAPLVDLVPAGSAPQDIFATLGHGGINHLLDALRNEAETLVVDVPPLSMAPEAGPILRGIEAAVLVVQAHRTRRQAVEKSITTFEDLGVPFCGVVLNRISYDLPPMIEQIL